MCNESKEMNYIFGQKGFTQAYRKMSDKERASTTWIIVHTSDKKDIYLKEYDQWLTINDYCKKSGVYIDSISLRWRTHTETVDTSDCEGIYLIKTARGSMGGETKDYFTIGKIIGDTVYRTMWSIPELIADIKFEDKLENCIQKAIVRHEPTSKN